jgi:PST family polysaccharide transporter
MWAIGGSLVAEPIRILGTAVLARLLTPADFGLIGMAAVFFGLTAITTELGPSAAIIRKRDLTHTETSSLFWLCTAVGLLLAVLAVLAAPLIARLYRDPSVGPVFAVLSLTILLSAEALVPNALLRRRMDFRIPAFANVSSVVVNAAVAIACALAGLGYWSLVVGTLAGVLTSVAVVGVGARFMPQLRVRRADVAPSAAFSTQVTGAEVANYAATNIDNLLVGRLLGSAALGIYALAYNLVTYPVRMFSSLVAQATLPALCRMADERQRMREAYVRALRLSSAVVLPALAFLGIEQQVSVSD